MCIFVKYSSCVPICVLYVFSFLPEGHPYQFPSTRREERLKDNMGSVFVKKRILDADNFSPVMWRSSAIECSWVVSRCIQIHLVLSLLPSWCFFIDSWRLWTEFHPRTMYGSLRGPVCHHFWSGSACLDNLIPCVAEELSGFSHTKRCQGTIGCTPNSVPMVLIGLI